tara:strand:+ start:1279 stop:2208 length:930 start_codon:yes stop_codon:yes gene_type:complete
MAQTYHLYADSYDFRAYMSGTDHVTDWDSDEAPIVRVLGSASKRIDTYLGRSFGIRTETHTFDIGEGALRNDRIFRGYGNEINDFPDYWSSKLSGDGIILLGDWLASATTVTAYGQTARTTSTVLTEGIGNDFLLEPYNRSPKTLLKLEEDTTDSFFGGQQTLTILGEWGWQTDKVSLSTIDAIGSTGTTSVSVASGAATYVGDTIIVDSEQMYVSAVSGNNLTVIRAVNGTTAATHSSGVTYYKWKYPDDVTQAALDIARTYWRSRDAGLTNVIGTGEMGMSNPAREETAILKRLDHYRNSRETAVYV